MSKREEARLQRQLTKLQRARWDKEEAQMNRKSLKDVGKYFTWDDNKGTHFSRVDEITHGRHVGLSFYNCGDFAPGGLYVEASKTLGYFGDIGKEITREEFDAAFERIRRLVFEKEPS